MLKVLNDSAAIIKLIDSCLVKGLTFAAYCLPGESKKTLVVQKDNQLNELVNFVEITQAGGFLIAPFAEGPVNKTYFIRPDYIVSDYSNPDELDKIQALEAPSLTEKQEFSPNETPKGYYLEQIEKALQEITTGGYEKIVLSRVKIIEGNYTTKLTKIFDLLCKSYPNAFVYLFQIKGHCWAGATPEPLICTKNNELVTVSLAGTREFNSNNTHLRNWNNKELKEQEFVTKYIEKILSEYKISEYHKKGPYTKKAGKLVHLRTDFSFAYNSISDKLAPFISALHPTSAVCGMPMEKSRRFIMHSEKHNREFYAGYIGPVGINDKLQLFVNLRCMKIFGNKLALFVGGGITLGSVPEEEWEETEIKADTLLSVVKQID